ncbi:hypothetical protein MFLAVUS_000883 [Mucor flavus]|uniref:C2H2-type domain-containing protein n=1 Tax=Mucor flavus TaxID=439312 RepID=A0ABP9YKY7_9FUNG
MSDQSHNSNNPAAHGTDHTDDGFDLYEWLQRTIFDFDLPSENTTDNDPDISQGFTTSTFERDNDTLVPQQNLAFDANDYTGSNFQASSGESCNSSPSLSSSFCFSSSSQSTPDSEYYSPPPSPSPTPARLRHEVTGATPPRRSNPITSHSCPKCNDKFSCLKAVIIHILSHSDNRKNGSHPCPLCDGLYSREQDVKRHLLSHFAIRNELCSHCPKTFKRRDSLIRHQRKCNLRNTI